MMQLPPAAVQTDFSTFYEVVLKIQPADQGRPGRCGGERFELIKNSAGLAAGRGPHGSVHGSAPPAGHCIFGGVLF